MSYKNLENGCTITRIPSVSFLLTMYEDCGLHDKLQPLSLFRCIQVFQMQRLEQLNVGQAFYVSDLEIAQVHTYFLEDCVLLFPSGLYRQGSQKLRYFEL